MHLPAGGAMTREYDFKGWHITVESEAIGWGGSPRGPVVEAKRDTDEYEISEYGLNGNDGRYHPSRRLPLWVLRRMLRDWTDLKNLTGAHDKEEHV